MDGISILTAISCCTHTKIILHEKAWKRFHFAWYVQSFLIHLKYIKKRSARLEHISVSKVQQFFADFWSSSISQVSLTTPVSSPRSFWLFAATAIPPTNDQNDPGGEIVATRASLVCNYGERRCKSRCLARDARFRIINLLFLNCSQQFVFLSNLNFAKPRRPTFQSSSSCVGTNHFGPASH